MPWHIESDNPDCNGIAVVKDDDGSVEGCHMSRREALAQMAALYASEGRELMPDDIMGDDDEIEEEVDGEMEEVEENEKNLTPPQYIHYEFLEKLVEEFGKFDQTAGASGSHYMEENPFNDEGINCANCVFYEGGGGCEIVSGRIKPTAVCKFWIIPEDLIGEPEEQNSIVVERREVDLKTPAFMASAARRGLRYLEEGHGGDGLVPATITDARKMANEESLSEDKWRRIGPWIARHMVDLDAPKNRNPNDPEYPGAGLVAHLLWGSGPSKEQARRAQDYAERIVMRLENEDRAGPASTPAPKKDQISGSDTNEPGSAKGHGTEIEISEATEEALQNKADNHNEAMARENKPEWTRVRVSALRSVYRRGAGAFSTSHRPGMTRGQWAMGRVNAFLYLARNGRPENVKYVSDNDLLHSDHPKYSGSK
jgi:hypothetical protein